MDYNANSGGIREANEICKLMGKRMKFKQCIIQQIVDDKIRQQASNDELNEQHSLESAASVTMAEELQIRVENLDKGTTVMWAESVFLDRLPGMRDALVQFEEKKQRAEEKAKARNERRMSRQQARASKAARASELTIQATELFTIDAEEENDKYGDVFGDVE